ncbi:hypothetical protein [Carnobacterium maltaromaticum]|uniref:hypothetical protein n=1 Tax=Carnobacterium maltaromaticum TaxID=2751 RepID=UPI0039B08F7B
MKDIVTIILDIATAQAENKRHLEESTGLITTAELRGKEVAYQEILEIINRA